MNALFKQSLALRRCPIVTPLMVRSFMFQTQTVASNFSPIFYLEAGTGAESDVKYECKKNKTSK